MPSAEYAELRRRSLERWAEWEDETVTRISVGTSAAALSVGAGETLAAIHVELRRLTRSDVRVLEVGDIGFSWTDPVVHIALPGRPRITYGSVAASAVPQFLEDVLTNDDLRPDLALGIQGPEAVAGIPTLESQPWMRDQLRLVMANYGHIEPGNLSHYVARGGFASLDRVLHEMTPQEVTDVVRESGLRGRGGALFPAGVKWSFMQNAPPGDRYLAVNGEEGDPAAFTDASIVENDPHRLVEGILIASYAMGASRSYIHIRAEYQLAVERLRRALAEADEAGLVGSGVMGTDFSHEIEIEATGHAYICGEETALMESVEGKRGAPRPRPPFPAQYGIFGKPTTVNNVKTIAYVPTVIEVGAEAFAKIGTENASGTAMLSLCGQIERPGIAEVPVGLNLRTVITDIAGGGRDGKQVKALQCGGPLGGIMSIAEADMPTEFQAMTAIGSPLGSGGILVFDEDTCVVDAVKVVAEFNEEESCGKCFPCRKGTSQIVHIFQRIVAGFGEHGDLEKIAGIGQTMVDGSLCGLGQLAPGVLNNAVRYFPEEFEEHVEGKYCRTGTCSALRGPDATVEGVSSAV